MALAASATSPVPVEGPVPRGIPASACLRARWKGQAGMKTGGTRRRCLAALSAVLLVTGGLAAAQGRGAPLHVMRSATLEGPLLVMAADAAAPAEAYVGDVRIRVAIEDGVRVYRALHRGVTRTLHVGLDAALRYVAFDPGRNRFEMLSPDLRVELADYGLLDDIVAAVDGAGGKAYPMLGFAVVRLSPQADPVASAGVIEALPGVLDVRLMPWGAMRVPD